MAGAVVVATGPMVGLWSRSASGSIQPVSTTVAPTLSRLATAPSASNLGRGVPMACVDSLARMMLCATLLGWAELLAGAGLTGGAGVVSAVGGAVGSDAGSGAAAWGGAGSDCAAGGIGSRPSSKAASKGSSSNVGSIGRPETVGSAVAGKALLGRSASTGSRLKPSVGNCNGACTAARLAGSGWSSVSEGSLGVDSLGSAVRLMDGHSAFALGCAAASAADLSLLARFRASSSRLMAPSWPAAR